MGQTSVDVSLDSPHVLFCKEVENLVKVLLLCHGGKSPEAVRMLRNSVGLSLLRGRLGVVVVDNGTIYDSLWSHG